jgi:hypothetical protein
MSVHVVKYLCFFHSFDVKLQPCLYRAYISVFFYYEGEGRAGGGGESSKQLITIMLIRASCLYVLRELKISVKVIRSQTFL